MNDPSVLREMHLFAALSPSELQKVESIIRVRKFRRGQQIIQEKSRGASIYLVKQGEFKVTHIVRGMKRELGTFRTGDHFGEVSFIDKKPRSASIYATEESELLIITRKSFDRILRDTPRLQIKLLNALLEDLCAKLRQHNDIVDFELSDLLPVSVFEIDKRGKIIFSNRTGLDYFQYTQRDFERGLYVLQMIIPAQQQDARNNFANLLKNEKSQAHEYTALRKDGSSFPVIAHSQPLLANRIARLRITLVDITQQKRLEAALRKAHDELELRVAERTAELKESEERYAAAIRGANDGLWDWNLITNEIYFSPRWKSMLGFEENEFGNTFEEWINRIHREDKEQFKRAINRHRDGFTQHFKSEHRILHKDGTYRWMLCRGLAVHDPKQKAHRMAGSQTDITERKRMEQQLIQNAFYDSLTGLPNRALFLDRLGLVIERARQHEKRRRDYLFAILYLDLDRFKNINDSLGHGIGDQLLIAMARRLSSCIRPGDTVARLGGDEFAILLDEIADLGNPTHVAKRIMNGLTLPFSLGSREIFVTASIGIAVSGKHEPGLPLSNVEVPVMITYERPEEILRDADTAMYRAKAKGKARFEIFNSGMHASAVAALQLETDLRWGIERKEYRIYYQPIVSLSTGLLTGFEALLRWQHPQRGLILPAEIIPLTEETGLIISIGQEILNEACRQIHQWNIEFASQPPLTISVNVSGKQLQHPKFVDQIKRILEETSLDPHHLKLEITESVMMENTAHLGALLSSLKARGVQLNLDDFGTGYSSLSSLRRFPIDTLKIDSSFVRGMNTNAENLHIVSTIMALARNLDMTVIAEGVEEPMQLVQLKTLHCQYAQGFHFSRPLDAESARILIEKRPQWFIG